MKKSDIESSNILNKTENFKNFDTTEEISAVASL